ncbi:SusD/RagB family nutrient-binding outer membrane lipoprotein [Flavobacterium oreochromis]|uniref:SusD/RagB family nutrient-binding outer membrane lipoprotein n=1 Tax=Flavobacterium oreochromis TaxID=2906078 RepID=UPI00385CF4D1
MKRNFIKSIFLISFGIATLNSCDLNDRFEKLNIDENNPTSVTPKFILSTIEKEIFSSNGGFGSRSDGDGFIGQFSQHFAGNHATGIQYDSYILTNGSFAPIFENAYLFGLKDCQKIIEYNDPRYKKYVGIAKILMAYKYGYLTSLYGDIPVTEALNSNIIKPKYDNQIEVYNQIQKLLAEAIIDLDTPNTLNISGDFIYNGNTNKWKAASYLLSARFYNHFSKKDPTGSATKALAAIDKAKELGMNSTDWDLLAKFDGGSQFLNNWVGAYSNGMIVANKPFINILINSNDPRTEALFSSLNKDDEDSYGKGKTQSGRPGDQNYASIGGLDSFYGQEKSSIPAASYCELLMIEAEAAFRLGNLNRASNAHNEAIINHVNQVTTLAIGKARIPAYIATYASETSSSISLEKIMTEKHKIMFAMSVESWMDFRRHDNKFPTWSSIPLNENETAPVSTKFIQRILYPQSELNLNSNNVPKGIDIFKKLPILE